MIILRKSNHYKATLILGIASLGFIMGYPFNHTFLGALISSCFSAAMIGGIADWFGVTALFRKPLGIPFRTEIIPRSRDKIFNSLVHMVEDELLTKEMLKKKIEKSNMSGKLILYLEKYEGKKDIEIILTGIMQDILSKTDPEEVSAYLDKLMNDTIPGIKLTPLILEAFEWTVKNGYDENIVSFIVNEIIAVMRNRQVNDLITEAISGVLEKVKKSSEKERAGKKFIFNLLFALMSVSNASPSRLAENMSSEILEYLVSLRSPDSDSRKKLKKWLEQGVERLKTNADVQQSIEDLARDLIKKIKLTPLVMQYIYEFNRDSGQNKVKASELHKLAEGLIDRVVTSFKNNKPQQEDLDAYIKQFLTRLVNEEHAEIGKMVRHKLDGFTNEMLAELIEEKAGNDLQIIRINGSVVGGIVGVIIFVFTYLMF